ncbi:MAG: hypothetical protein HUJ87_15060 [Fusobacterium varium]|uniref:hypothetical protein n=1 Tax=Fusobacterium varium TaxID=856 RepID=UPI00242F1811|nr:hypothetical protein [Fusobacterium varium]MCF0171812.1 hypothetical protein [Fusobacterium varium]
MAHRRWGKDFIALVLFLICAIKYPGNYYIFAPYFRQVKEIVVDGKTLNGLPLLESLIPKEILKNPKSKSVVNKSDWSITLFNDSKIFFRGADNPNSNVGVGARGVIYTEAALMKPGFYQYMKPAVDMVINKTGFGVVIFISTPRGKYNWFTQLFIDYFTLLKKKPSLREKWYVDIQKASTSKAWNGKPVLNDEYLEEQRLTMAPDVFEQEYECKINIANIGAWYGKEMKKAFEDKRIGRYGFYQETVDTSEGHKISYSGYYWRTAPLYVSWDIGKRDNTVLWFFQINPTNGRIRFIHHYRASGVGPDHMCEYIKTYIKKKGFTVQPKMILPHDGDVEEWSATSKRSDYIRSKYFSDTFVLSKTELAASKLTTLITQINVIRKLWDMVEIDNEECAEGIIQLQGYIKKFNKSRMEYEDIPDHDANNKASDDADSFRTGMIYYNIYLKGKLKTEDIKAYDCNGNAIPYNKDSYTFILTD